MSNQVIRVQFNDVVRIIANREGSIRFNPDVAGKPVLNFTAVMIFGSKDNEDPCWIDVSLWGDVAAKYNGLLEHGQTARLNSQLEISLEEYNGETKLKGKISCNNGYQFMLFGDSVKGNTPAQQQVEVPAQSIAPATSKKSSAVPF